VPEDAISGTLALYSMCSLLTFTKDYARNHVIPYRKGHFFTSKKRENPIESISRQNCIFGGFSPVKKPAILSSQKSSALLYLCIWSATDEGSPYDYRKKLVGMRQSRTPTHPDISIIIIEVIQSKAIQKRDYTRSAQCVIKLFDGCF